MQLRSDSLHTQLHHEDGPQVPICLAPLVEEAKERIFDGKTIDEHQEDGKVSHPQGSINRFGSLVRLPPASSLSGCPPLDLGALSKNRSICFDLCVPTSHHSCGSHCQTKSSSSCCRRGVCEGWEIGADDRVDVMSLLAE